jgi:hypothetical protein
MLTINITTRGRNPIPTRRSFVKGLDAAFDKGIKRVQESFKQHGSTYSGGLTVEVERKADEALIASADERFRWVALGTKPHIITARSGGSLAFQPNYTAKTVPNTIPSRAGGSSGGFVYAQSVAHPGVDARETQVAMASDVAPIFIGAVKAVIRG